MPYGGYAKQPLGKGVWLSILLLVIGFRLFSGTPVPWVREAEAAAIILMLCYVFVRFVLIRLYLARARYSLFELYLLALQFIPLYSAWRAKEVFGQPLIYGVLTQRYVWVGCAALIFMDFLRRKVIAMSDVERAFVILSWAFLLAYTALVLTVNPADYAGHQSFVSRVSGEKYIFKLEPVLLAFGLFYYLLKGLLLRLPKYFLMALPFMSFMLFVVDKRSFYMALAVVVVWVMWLFTSPIRFIELALKIGGALVIIVLGIYVLSPEIILGLTHYFAEAALVVLSGESGEDASSNARIVEALIAMPYIEDHWFLGNGDLSDQWNNGYSGVIGYFYPSDIGFVGGLFVFGMLGMLILYLQFLFLKRPGREIINFSEEGVFWIVMYAVSLLLLAQSFIRGVIVFTPAVTLIFIAVTYQANLMNRVRMAMRVKATGRAGLYG